MAGAEIAARYGVHLGRLGIPGFHRRLTDKILAAFNHAYAVGDVEVARQLRAILALAEDHERGRVLAETGKERRAGGATDQADLWIAFVEARNSYQTECNAGRQDTAEAQAAFEGMKRAYQRWSAG